MLVWATDNVVFSLKLQASYMLAVAFPNLKVTKPPMNLVVEHINKGKHVLLYYSFVYTYILATIFQYKLLYL